MLEEAYRKLVAELEEATAIAEAAIDEAERGQRAKTDLEDALVNAQLKTLTAFAIFLEDTGNERLKAPVSNMWGELFDTHFKARIGGALKPIGETYKLANAAALVTVLVRDYGANLDTALNKVSEHTGLDERKLNNYRNKLLSRKNASEVELFMYESCLEDGRTNLARGTVKRTPLI